MPLSQCKHARPREGTGPDFAVCAIDRYWMPHISACNHCDAYDGPPRVQQVTVSAPPVAVPREQWPPWVQVVALRAQPGDVGIGDTIARELGPTVATIKDWFASKGINCGCDARRERLNAVYPY